MAGQGTLERDTFPSSSPFVPLITHSVWANVKGNNGLDCLMALTEVSVMWTDSSVCHRPHKFALEGEEEVSANPKQRESSKKGLNLWAGYGHPREGELKMPLFGLMPMLNHSKSRWVFSVHSWAERRRNDTQHWKQGCKDYFPSGTRREP